MPLHSLRNQHRISSICLLFTRGAASAASRLASTSSHNFLAPRLPEGLPAPQDWAIRSATFVKSSSALSHLPAKSYPEFVLIGRSNVGKSSLVNLLTKDPSLARVSKKPGSTQTINHFLINRNWYLVDCPGYGHARVSKQQRHSWHELTKDYLVHHPTLAHVFLLLDASAPLQPMDLDAVLWVHDSGRPWSLVFTKVDALQPGQPHPMTNMAHAVASIKGVLGVEPYHVPTTAGLGLGGDTMLKYISQLRQSFKMPLIMKT